MLVRGTALPLSSQCQTAPLPARRSQQLLTTTRLQCVDCSSSRGARGSEREMHRRRRRKSMSSPSSSSSLSPQSTLSCRGPLPPRRPLPRPAAAAASAAAAATAAASSSSSSGPAGAVAALAAATEAATAALALLSESLRSALRSLSASQPARSLTAALAAASTLPAAKRDALAAVATALGAYALVKFFDMVATKGWLDQKLTRKLVHTLAGPLYVATWPLFSSSETSRFAAAAVPALNGLRLVLAGTGVTSSEGSVRSMTRHGDRRELLRGPLYYVAALIVATLAFWRGSPASACAVAAMCGGDGLADIVGRRAPPGSPRIPWNRDKTLRGSAAMFAASMAFAVALVWLFSGFGHMSCGGGSVVGVGAGGAGGAGGVAAAAAAPSAAASSAAASAASSPPPSLSSLLFSSFSTSAASASAFDPATLSALAAVSLAVTAVESLPANRFVDDNVSVPTVAMLLGWWLFERC